MQPDQDIQTAYDHVMDNVHRRAFLDKLTQLRPQYAPKAEQEADDIVNLGIKLAAGTDDAPIPSRSAANGRNQIVDAEAQATAFDLALAPTIYEAVVKLKMAETIANRTKTA